jgi:hypothetical protein
MRTILTVFILNLFIGLVSGQCPEGDVLISSEEEAIAYLEKYPNCTKIEGNFTIGPPNGQGATRIEKLPVFEKIQVIKGNLTIHKNQWLKVAPEFPQLDTVGRNLTFKENVDFAGIVAFPVKEVGGDFSVACASWKAFIELRVPELVRIGGNLWVNANLSWYSFFPKLKEVGLAINIYDQPAKIYQLNDFHQLESCDRINFNMHNKELTITGFEKLKNLQGLDLELKTSGPLKLGNLKPDYITLNGLPADLQLNFLKEITSLKSLNLYEMPSDGLKYFPNLKKVDFFYCNSRDRNAWGTVENLPSIDTVETLILGGQCMRWLPAVKTISKQFQIRGMVDSTLFALLDDCPSVPELSINGAPILKEIGHPIKIKANKFEITGIRQFKSFKGIDLSNIEAKEIKFSSLGIESLEGLKGEPKEDCTIIFDGNTEIKECAFEKICAWNKDRPEGKPAVIFKGFNGICTDEAYKKACAN